MDKLTLLTHKQLYSSNITNRLDIINKIGPKAAITDFSILLGGAITEFYNNEGKKYVIEPVCIGHKQKIDIDMASQVAQW